jgi:hypothetical protein
VVTNNLFRSDLPKLYNITQNAMILYPKEIVIYTLRDFFSRDSWYSARTDQFGYPLTPDQTNLPPDAGIHDNSTTRLFIGESYRFDLIFYPALLVRHGGSTSVPISFNREAYNIQWGNLIFEDGYGNIKTFPTPEYFIQAGAWEGTINIEVRARDLRARDDLVDLVSILFVEVAFNDLVKSGLIIKGVSAGAPTEFDDRNDKVFAQTVTLSIRSEWRRSLPILNIIDMINFSIEFQRLDPPPPGNVAQNLTISTEETITDLLSRL